MTTTASTLSGIDDNEKIETSTEEPVGAVGGVPPISIKAQEKETPSLITIMRHQFRRLFRKKRSSQYDTHFEKRIKRVNFRK